MYARPLVAALPDDVSCFGMRLSTWQVQSLESLDITDLGGQFAADLSTASFGRPVHLAGFSFAGFLAYETARALTAAGVPPARLWLFDTSVRDRTVGHAFAKAPICESLLALRYLKKNWRDLIRLRRDPNILRRYGLIRMDLNRHPDAYRNIIRCLYGALERYRPEPWSRGPVTLFRAKNERFQWCHARDLGWRRLVGEALDIVDVPGDHLSMLGDPDNARIVATSLCLRLDPRESGRA
jgi:thioesterase domain-containing protein